MVGQQGPGHEDEKKVLFHLYGRVQTESTISKAVRFLCGTDEMLWLDELSPVRHWTEGGVSVRLGVRAR